MSGFDWGDYNEARDYNPLVPRTRAQALDALGETPHSRDVTGWPIAPEIAAQPDPWMETTS